MEEPRVDSTQTAPEPDEFQNETPNHRAATLERINPKHIFAVATVITLVALGATTFYLFFINPNDWTLPSFVVVIVLMFFALSTANSLLFVNSTRIGGTLMGLTVAVAGPVALWFSGMLLFFYLIPPATLFPPKDPLERPLTLEKFGDIVTQVMKREFNWSTYTEWKKDQDTVDEIFDEEEPTTLRNLLGGLYETRKSDGKPLAMLGEPHITTVFFYFEKVVIKVQRITGLREGENTYIRFESHGTESGAKTASVIFVGDSDKNTGILRRMKRFSSNSSYKGYYEEISENPVDCLILAYYDDVVQEDYLIVNLKRFSNDLSGRIDLAAVSLDEIHPINASSFWQIQPPLFLKRIISSTSNEEHIEVPLVFQKVRGADVEAAQKVHNRIIPWLETLDVSLANDQIGDSPVRNLVEAVRGAFENATGAPTLAEAYHLIKEENFKAYHLEDARYASMMLLRR
ncbi:hypothetical protein Noc_1297 [Nitrosococcus oceani ATCC 19707]|uniref:Uncharacterized protein n=2 Tax=Nitrosococcus oceani TaxID=1229 RepID=Q3JBK0_NITOC|nr:FUSC family protein [Nitrosococcus oceani]ABA57796.1 hypothetical protein Noc_1297 [Nitrosococcus oceani ATCC 19707]EDZ67887.1 hypothetical protein NOC27_1214 [Nitrosococcus oceani AFC27]KFI19779.1 hypothetical protein IB75_06755 [Nitrosococcus oceani C-27]GEM21673.1 FUSC family protein [Nitrosococcus oceani]